MTSGLGGPTVRLVKALSRTQLLVLAAAAALALVATAIAVVALGARGAKAVSPAVGVRLPQAAQVRTLLLGIPQHGLVLGDPGAPIRLVEYFDLQCPYCRLFALDGAPTVIERYVRTGKVQYEAVPLAFVGADSVRGRDALVAAAAQNHGFDFETLLYENQGAENTGWLSDAMVAAAARSIRGLDLARFDADRAHAETAQFESAAKADGVSGTPTFVVHAHGTTTTLVNPSMPKLLAALR